MSASTYTRALVVQGGERDCDTNAVVHHLDGDGHDIGLFHNRGHSNKALEELRHRESHDTESRAQGHEPA